MNLLWLFYFIYLTSNMDGYDLSRYQRLLLSQLGTDKSPFLMSYKHKINSTTHPYLLCPLCSDQPQNTAHLFQCKQIQTTFSSNDLWNRSCQVAKLLESWRRVLDDPSPQ